MPHGGTATLKCAVLHAQTVPDVYMPHGGTATLKCAVLHAQTDKTDRKCCKAMRHTTNYEVSNT
jgi:hypothetical protein